MILQTVYDLCDDRLKVRVHPRGDYYTCVTTYRLNFSESCLEKMKLVMELYRKCELDDWEDDDGQDLYRDGLYSLLDEVPDEVHWELQGNIENHCRDEINDWCGEVLEEIQKEKEK